MLQCQKLMDSYIKNQLKLTLCENEHLLKLVEGDGGETKDHLKEATFDTAVIDKSDVHADVTTPRYVGLDDFKVLKVVGQGAFGKVYQVRKIRTSEILAMKVMRKDKILEKDHAEFMKTERDVLTKIDHPFVVQLRYSFQTKYRLYLVLDFVNGGHLFFQLHRQGLFREDLARIYTAEIASAVSHLHSNGIMHRDLKPENILLDADGHVVLTDFGLAKQFNENTRSNSLCGTIEYMAPEIILGKGHDKAADGWSVGVLLYEMPTGKPPFVGNRQKVQQKIIKDKIKPASIFVQLCSFIVERAATQGGKQAPWLWDQEEQWTNMPLLDSPAASPKSGENPFNGFSYVRPAVCIPAE
ncbi:hypothetical protein K7X08_020279 [Anisodus acutangulus]|uniref:non-specific serine/threonine protein kinase n=1 Tax=Anisodus acutangulus TaxID=402998 RepID=A0A9Q1M6S3_9SOLA|nr:hypothetical protein K7X08_020279 [Anisodus acutangulus]